MLSNVWSLFSVLIYLIFSAAGKAKKMKHNKQTKDIVPPGAGA